MKKVIAVLIASTAIVGVLAGCGSSSNPSNTQTSQSGTNPGATSGAISVLSREDGSGTRGAFIELLGIQQKNADGNKVDNTIDSSEITNSTAVMMQTVAGNKSAIGYISLGSLNDTVKALKVDGVEATPANVKDGSYKVARPFNIVTKDGLSDAAQDFINYILSDEGQKIVEENEYVSQGSTGAYKSNGAKGKVTVAGSSSVTPVMEKIAESYQETNSNVSVEVQESDSTTGITSATEGVCDIGMASRELTDEEKAAGVKPQAIALDGIAIIINNSNSINKISNEDVQKIYTGEITDWSQLNK
ncbi:MAG: extracellular solute-binding protein [Clostridia bacterium]|jgi:phosphate transport system substrate-binding protein|nr:extracellular solute-binding protein [Clostridia bacterium]